MEVGTYDDFITPEHKLHVETRLVKYLRMWCDDPDAIVSRGHSVEREIADLLEWYICECISHDPSGRLNTWWSDGVIHLQIEQTSDTTCKLLGVTWIDSEGYAPFEIDVTLAPRNEKYFAKCIFRLGILDDRRNPAVYFSDPRLMLEMRPRYNRDWAMAVELTPSDEHD